MIIHSKQLWLLCTSAVSGVLVGVALPTVRQIVVSSLSPRFMALAAADLLAGVVWGGGITEDKDGDADSSVSSGCDDTDYNRRLIFDWTDDDLDDEYFYNYDND